MTTITTNTPMDSVTTTPYVSTISSVGYTYRPAGDFYYGEYIEEKEKRKKAEAELDKAKVEIAILKKKLEDVKELMPKKILTNGDYMTVLWEDDTKTIVKRAEGEPASNYAAFTAAMGIRIFGTNSALKRVVASAVTQGKKKKAKEVRK